MSVQDTLEQLAACLCAQIITDGSPGVCFCGLVPGEAVALDYLGDCPDGLCGMAWTRLITAYPATILGTPSLEPGNCAIGLGLDIELGIARCASMPATDGTPPSDAQLLADTQQQVADMETMRRAVLCCNEGIDWILTNYTAQGPQGGLVGGSWVVSTIIY